MAALARDSILKNATVTDSLARIAVRRGYKALVAKLPTPGSLATSDHFCAGALPASSAFLVFSSFSFFVFCGAVSGSGEALR